MDIGIQQTQELYQHAHVYTHPPKAVLHGLDSQVTAISPTAEQSGKCPGLLTPVVQDTVEETHFSLAVPRRLKWDLHNWEEGGQWGKRRVKMLKGIKGTHFLLTGSSGCPFTGFGEGHAQGSPSRSTGIPKTPRANPCIPLLPHSVNGFLCPLPCATIDGACPQKTGQAREKLKFQ